MAHTQQLGHLGEEAAVQYLLERDYHILARNWRCPPLEVDIIAEHFGESICVEVKTRANEHWESAEAAVDAAKRRHLSDAAKRYLQQQRRTREPFRFDIITLVGAPEAFEITHFECAFDFQPTAAKTY